MATATAIPAFLLQGSTAAPASIIYWLGWILAAAVLIIVVAFFVRRLLVGRDEEPNPAEPGFTLGDLRDMHRAGRLNDEEFETAKKALIARSRAAIDAPPEELPAIGMVGEDLAARADGIDHTTDAAKRGMAEPEELAENDDDADDADGGTDGRRRG